MLEIKGRVLVETKYVGSNNSIIRDPGGLVLVDSPQKPTDALEWRKTIEGLGHVSYLVNTDHHLDHTIGNFFLPGIVVGQEGTRSMLLDNPPGKPEIDELIGTLDPDGLHYLENFSPRVPTISFNNELTLHLTDIDLRLVHMRGHTPSNIVAVIPQLGIAFTGDLVCESGLPSFVEADTFAWLDAVRRIEKLDIDTIVPGHGEVCGREQATRFRQMMEELIGIVGDQISAGRGKAEAVERIEFDDRIYHSTDGSPGYPAALVRRYQTGSIAAIYDHLIAASRSA